LGNVKTEIKMKLAGNKSRIVNITSGNRQQLLGAVLLFIVLEVSVLSIELAKWITPQPLLTLVLCVSMLATWLIYRSRVHGVIKHTVLIIAGGLVTLWQAISVAGFGQSTVYFAIFISAFAWLMGYISVWQYLKKQNAWVAVILGALAVLVNLGNLPDKYFIFFGIYFVVAIVFLVQNKISKNNSLSGAKSENRNRSNPYLVTAIIGIAVLAIVVTWIMPALRIPQLESFVATNTLWTRNIKESGLNFFASVMSKQPKTTSAARRYLQFGTQWHQDENIYFIVDSVRPSYWQVYVYDVYNTWGWANSPTSRHVLDKDDSWERTVTYQGQETITYEVQAELKTDVLLTTGEFTSADMPVLVHENAGDIVSVTTPRLLQPQEKYALTSTITNPAPQQLSATGTDYPENITGKYLQLPEDFPESVRELSANITREALTPYDKVVAIDTYLSTIPYEEEIEAPPEGVDGVEYFLMTQKSGFCTYYASAMAVMLRSVDVPARLVVGYLPGDLDINTGKYLLRDRHYHAWPQAYFPGYGWINLEATPGSAVSEVSVESPWVSSSEIQAQAPRVDMQYWEALAMWQEAQYWGASSSQPARVEMKDPKWPFAEILGTALLWTIGIALILLVIMIPILIARASFNRWLWGVVRSDCATAIYSRMCALAELAKMGPKPQQTPLEYSSELAVEFPMQAKALHDIAQTYANNRFGGREGKLGLMEEAELLKARHIVYNGILARLGFFSKIFRR
jgi:transglutaminase-like putative cysteine protease